MYLLHLALALLVVCIWGFNYVVIRVGLLEISPLLLCFTRFFLTSLATIFFVKVPKGYLRLICLYGLVMFALQFSLLFISIHTGLSPGLASLLIQAQVFFAMLLGVAFENDRPSKWQIIGAFLAFSGIILIASNANGNITGLGFACIMGSAMCWGVGNIIAKKIGKINILSLISWGSLVAWPPILLVSFLLEGPSQILLNLHKLSWLTFASVLYTTFLSTLFGFWIWNYLLQRHSVTTLAPLTLMVPLVAMSCSVIFLGEPLPSWKIVAGALIILGLIINFVGPLLVRKKESPTSPSIETKLD